MSWPQIQNPSIMGNGSDGSNFTLVGNKLINNKSSKSALKGSLRGSNDESNEKLAGGKSAVESISAKVCMSSIPIFLRLSILATDRLHHLYWTLPHPTRLN